MSYINTHTHTHTHTHTERERKKISYCALHTDSCKYFLQCQFLIAFQIFYSQSSVMLVSFWDHL